jgi:hypothetical protein
MRKDLDRPTVSNQLHPWVYAAIAGLAACYVVAIWFGFAGSGYTDYLLAIASFFILGALALPFIAWRVWRGNHAAEDKSDDRQVFRDWEAFRNWALGEFDIGQGHVSGLTAAVEILLPVAAVAVGMLAFAVLARLSG